jgi:trimethylamine---corrinoid protein Co-methyltransferase
MQAWYLRREMLTNVLDWRGSGEKRLLRPAFWRVENVDSTGAHSIGSAGWLRILSPGDLHRLDTAALDVLAGIGVSIPSERAREALVAQGAKAEGGCVRIPPDLVRRLVALAPSRLTLGARATAPLVTGERSLLTTDGCCVEIYDFESGQKRAATAADVVAISRVVDAMPELDFCWPAVSAQDRPAEVRGLHELYLAIAGTGKHVQTVTVVEPELAEVAVAMARAVAGSAESLRAEPPVSALLGTVTPLGNDAGTLEAGLVFAEAGVPTGFVTMPMGGSTTPITMAGSLVVGIAEALSAVCVIQAAFPGAPVFVSFIPSVMDLRTGDFSGGAPEDTVMGAAAADIGRFYGLPTQCGVNSSGAKEPGWQSALDDTTTTFLSLAAGVDMLTGVGMVSGGRIFSYEEMALAADTVTQARVIAGGIDLSALSGSSGGGTPAAPPAAGPSLIHDQPHRYWAAGGRQTAVDRAHERVAGILAAHEPVALDAALDAELRRLAGIG